MNPTSTKSNQNLLYILAATPLLVYTAAYTYLAIYHGRFNIINTVVHEGGTYTLWETTFYASHFLGHIPVHLIAAFLLLGSFRCFSRRDVSDEMTGWSGAGLSAGLVILLVGSLALSLLHFGLDDTLSYILQRKQGVDNYVPGGSWNLHLGSTTMLFLLTPIYVYTVMRLASVPVVWRRKGLILVSLAAGLMVLFTVMANGRLIFPLVQAWSDPRYLAHSVRELATFPLTYFPLPLFFLLRSGADSNPGEAGPNRAVTKGVAVLAALFLAGLAYQAILPLRIGISDLAQNPSFAKEGGLSIPYLLASHYFEHFLDTLFFTLLTLIIAVRTRKQSPTPS